VPPSPFTGRCPCACALQLQAYEESQHYKVGKFIIEKAHMKKAAHWPAAAAAAAVARPPTAAHEDEDGDGTVSDD
jgi:hypothetical protein